MHPVNEFSLQDYFVISKFVIIANGVTGERFGVCVSHNFSNFARVIEEICLLLAFPIAKYKNTQRGF